jgi:glycosyltransferase involved in cell wall biosynthesis
MGRNMNILVIPTTDWISHPVPNRLNFIFDTIAARHNVYVLHFALKKFQKIPPRETACTLIRSGFFSVVDPSLYYIINSPVHLAQILKACKELSIDVILSSNILPSFLSNFAGVPIVFDYLDHLEESASIYYPGSMTGKVIKSVTKLVTRFNLDRAEEVITVSDEFENFLRNKGIENVTVIPNGVDTEILVPVPRDEAKAELGLLGKSVIGYIGSLEYWVDLEGVIGALPELDATLLIVGPGLFTDYGEKLQKITADLGVSEQVIFAGAVAFDRLSLYISAMDIGLNPLKHMKKNELTIGGKVFNYLSCGVPVLSSRMIALEHFFRDEIFYYDDRQSFISQVRDILEHPVDGAILRSIARQYDWNILADKYEEVLMRAAGSQR